MKNKLTNHVKSKIGKWQVLYSEERNFIWLKNAKTAGTSMYRGIMRKEIYDLVSYKENPKEFSRWWDDLTDEKIKDYFMFTFVRNPFSLIFASWDGDEEFPDFVKYFVAENVLLFLMKK